MLERKSARPDSNCAVRKKLTLAILLLSPLAFSVSAAARSHLSSSHPAQSPQDTTHQARQEVVTLEAGVPVERELAAGQRHQYQLALAAGQYVKVEIKQLGIYVRASLQQPNGQSYLIIDIPLKKPEVSFEQVAEAAGLYRLDVFALTKTPAGRYEIRIAELRPATENERALQQAYNLFAEHMQFTRAGKYAAARPLLLRVLEIRERVLGPEHPDVAETLAYLASNYELTGDYASAEPLELRALKIREKVYGPNHPLIARSLFDLGILYYQKGDYLKAEELLQKTLGIFEQAHATENLTVASALSYLGDIYYARSDYEPAKSYYQRALAVREKILGLDSFHLTSSLGAIGRVAYDAGAYAQAAAMFGRALTLSEKAFGPDAPQITSSLNNLATLYATTGDYAQAEALYQRALAIHEQKTGLYAPNVEATLLGLARLDAARGLTAEAVQLQTQVSELEERYVGLNLAVGSERERLALLNDLSLLSSRRISLHTQLAPNDPAARDLALTTILRRKGRVQDALAADLTALRQRFGAADQKLLDELSDTTSKLANLFLEGVQQKATPAERQAQIKSLEQARENLEAEISQRSAGYYQRAQPVTVAAVQAAIPVQAALIEFAVYRPFDPKAPDNQKAYGAPRYVAYVVRRQGESQWAELGAVQEIDSAVALLRQALRDPERQDVRRLARALDAKVMQPVRSLAGDATQLLVSPDGELNLLPFAALVDERGRYLVERYSFTYLTSGRDLLHMGGARQSKSNPVIIANPSFGEPRAAGQVAKNTTTARPTAPGAQRRSVTAARSLSDIYFAPLGGTTQEARGIQTLFTDASLLAGDGASESALKGLVAPRILHIATHGFFLQDVGTLGDNANPLMAATRNGGGAASAQIENPLLRSGLALAGANARNGGGSSSGDDGILTALEASGLNLWGTKLVVLSACDTGLGEVRNGEGVYGLRRAFVLAGTESLVMSLWPVSDYSTRRLMTDYYKNLKGGMGRGASLRQVQLDMLRRDKNLHPFYWANFIQSGEWANLAGQR